MKNHGLLLMSCIALLSFSCSKDETVKQDSINAGDPAILSIALTGENNAKARAVGIPTEESKVNDGIIYVFNAKGEILKKAYFKSGDITGTSGSKTIETTTAAASVSVLLNTGIYDSTMIVGTDYDVVSENQLEQVTVNLALTGGTGAGTQEMNNLLMSGTSSSPINFTGTPKTASVRVDVSRIVSKIVIDWSFEPNSPLSNKIKLVGAIILNTPLSSHLFGSSLFVTGTKYLEALSADTLSKFPFSGYKPADGTMVSNIDLLSVSNFAVSPVPANHFYVFENTSQYPTIVAIVADFNENGIQEGTPNKNLRKYYPIVINKGTTGLQDGTMTIKRNVTYNVKATVKGIGVDNPFEPIDPASLIVTVNVADWALIVNVNQTFE